MKNSKMRLKAFGTTWKNNVYTYIYNIENNNYKIKTLGSNYSDLFLILHMMDWLNMYIGWNLGEVLGCINLCRRQLCSFIYFCGTNSTNMLKPATCKEIGTDFSIWRRAKNTIKRRGSVLHWFCPTWSTSQDNWDDLSRVYIYWFFFTIRPDCIIKQVQS